MAVDLRPLSLGELLDRCFKYYRSYFLLFVGILIVPIALLALIKMLYQVMLLELISTYPVSSPHPRIPGLLPILYSLTVLVISVGGCVCAQGAATSALSQIYLDRPVTISSAYRSLKGRYGELVWLAISVGFRILLFLIPFIIGVAVTAAGARSGVAPSVLIGIVLMIAGLIVAAYFTLPYSLATPALVVENIEPRDAIDRCSYLADGYRWQLLLIDIFMFVISMVAAFLVQMPFIVTTALAAIHKTGPHPLLAVITAGASELVTVLTVPLIVIAFTIAYYERRVRKEGFDLQVMLKSDPPGSRQGMPSAPAP
jgi:hypothetical protein